MYRIIRVQPFQEQHTGKDKFPECHIFYNYDRVKIITGCRANLEALKYISDHAWFAKKTEFGLDQRIAA